MGPGVEFDLIRRLVARWGSTAVGLGDDAAVLDVPPGTKLVVSTDTSVDLVHFRSDWLTPGECAYRATVAALSDLAAMAAEPLGMLIAATLQSSLAGDLDELADGIAEAARAASCPIVGGDLTRGDRLSLTVTVLGTCTQPVRRSGAAAGQDIVVTGELGGPAESVRAFLAGMQPAPAHRERFARPVPRLAEARWLAAAGATALIDISDGLVPEARHVAAASGVTLAIDLGAVPVMQGADVRTAVASGEEYELLATVPPGLDVDAFVREFQIRLTRIGRVEAGEPTAAFLEGGARVDLPGGYDHFSP
jgi:thiamine-monophosphate kinase